VTARTCGRCHHFWPLPAPRGAFTRPDVDSPTLSGSCKRTLLRAMMHTGKQRVQACFVDARWTCRRWQPKDVRMTRNEALREALADLAHEQWRGWLRWMLGSEKGSDTPRVDVPWWRERWTRQMETVYRDLSEGEQESDRREADRVMAVLERFGEVPPETADEQLARWCETIEETDRPRARGGAKPPGEKDDAPAG